MRADYRISRIICGFILFYITYSVIRMLFKKTSSPTYTTEELVKWKPAEEVSCHVLRIGDDLPILHRNASLPEKSIFFHETSCTGGLTSRQACAVESAAKAHPEHQINVLFTSPVAVQIYTSHGSYLKKLANNYKNVKFARILLREYAKGTPLESTVKEMRNDNVEMHISKILKYLTLYNFSGIYVGWDAIVARSFDELWKNWAVRETSVTMSSQMFSFSKNKAGRKLAQLALSFLISELSITNKLDFWSYKGPNVIAHVLQHWCSTSKIQVMTLATCEDLAVYGPELFYPISFYERQAYFNGSNWKTWKDKRVFTYFTWQDFTKYNLVTKESLYQNIANEYCPIVSSIYGNKGLFYV